MISISISSFNGDSLIFTPSFYGRFEIRTSKHGASSLSVSAVVGEQAAISLTTSRSARKIIVTSSGVPLWRGILTDSEMTGDTVEFTALGYWSILKQQPLSGFWSHTLANEWGELPPTHTGFANERFSTDNDGRLYIGLKSGEDYDTTPRGNWFWEYPDGSINSVEEFSFSYDVSLPSGYTAYVASANLDNSGQTVEWSLAGDGTQQTGSESITGLSDERLIFYVARTSTADAYASETDEFYAYINSLRIKSTASATVDGSEIIEELWAEAKAVNPTAFSGGIFAEAGGNDFQDVLYTDATVASVIESLEDAGNSSSEALSFNISRYNHATFKPAKDTGQVWIADISGLTVSSSLDGYSNNLYVRYKDGNGLVRRTDTASAPNDLAPGIALSDFVDYRTTSQSEAEAVRSAVLAANAEGAVKAKVVISNVRPATGDIIGKEFVRGGDRMILSGLPYNFQSPTRRLLEFNIVDATYDAVNDQLRLSLGLGNYDQRDAIVEALTGEFDYVEI